MLTPALTAWLPCGLDDAVVRARHSCGVRTSCSLPLVVLRNLSLASLLPWHCHEKRNATGRDSGGLARFRYAWLSNANAAAADAANDAANGGGQYPDDGNGGGGGAGDPPPNGSRGLQWDALYMRLRNHVDAMQHEWEAQAALGAAPSQPAAGAGPAAGAHDVRQLIMCTIAEHDATASGFVTPAALREALVTHLGFPLGEAEVDSLGLACPRGGADGRNVRDRLRPRRRRRDATRLTSRWAAVAVFGGGRSHQRIPRRHVVVKAPSPHVPCRTATID